MAPKDLAARSGLYVNQLTGDLRYKAFIPKPLPPNPPVNMSMELWMLLSDADRALGRLDGVTETLPNQDLFVAMYVRKEAVLSSQIEGTQASLVDLLEYETDRALRGLPHDVGELFNYVDAMNYGLDRLREWPLSLRLIREIHGQLLRDGRGSERNPGEFRASQNWIGPDGCTLSQATFVPPPPEDMKIAMGDLESFVRDESPMPALLKVGLVHAQFETIHPFLDGNGRIGRLLITFLLCERSILKKPLLYLSYYFKRNRLEYYDRLTRTRTEGDWEGWLAFFLKGVYEVSQQATNTARRIISMQAEHRQMIRESFPSALNALSLLDKLYYSPVTTVKEIQQRLGISKVSANNLVSRFEQSQLLRQINEGRRNRVFAYAPYLDLFLDDESPEILLPTPEITEVSQ